MLNKDFSDLGPNPSLFVLDLIKYNLPKFLELVTRAQLLDNVSQTVASSPLVVINKAQKPHYLDC